MRRTSGEDLFYRLSVVDLGIPALRHRPEDLPLLLEAFFEELVERHGKTVEKVDDEVVQLLSGYSWPGNVRELRHVLERAVLVCPGRTLRKDHLPDRLRSGVAKTGEQAEITPLSEVEEAHIRRALALGLPIEETARRLGIDPSTLWRKRKKYDL